MANCVTLPSETTSESNNNRSDHNETCIAVNNCDNSSKCVCKYCDIDSTPDVMPILLRGSLARSIYDRMQREEQLRNYDRRKWYKCDNSLLPRDLQQLFVEMTCDEETQQFLDLCYEKSDWYFTHLFHSVARALLCVFMSSTSANGLLGRGSMFVFSDKQFTSLMGNALPTNYAIHDSIMLDLGAGDGRVSAIIAKYFGKVFVTEISPVMRKILTKRGYEVVGADEWHQNDVHYDLISCLNLLDRCDKPLTILKQMKSRVKPNTGLILLALVLPFSQYVEVNAKANNHKASETLQVNGTNFETQLASFRDNVLIPNGLELIKWTKLPYLCEGDLDLTYYWLNDVVMLIRPVQ